MIRFLRRYPEMVAAPVGDKVDDMLMRAWASSVTDEGLTEKDEEELLPPLTAAGYVEADEHIWRFTPKGVTRAERLEHRDNGRRIAGLAACCLVAAATALIGGLDTSALMIAPIGLGIWLIARSSWPARMRLMAFLGVLWATALLTVGFFVLASIASGD